MVDHFRLQLDQITEFGPILGVGQIGVTTDRARSRARRIQQNRVKRPLEPARIDDNDFGWQMHPCKVFPNPLHPLLGVIDRRHLRTCGGKLHGFAPGRGAKVEHGLAFLWRKDFKGQRRGSVLHPPIAFGKTGHGGDLPRIGDAHRSGGQDGAAHGRGQTFRISFRGQIQWRTCEMRGLDSRHRVGPPGFCQRTPQPFWQARRAQGRPCLWPFGGDFAQNGIGQPLEVSQFFMRCDQFDHRIHHAVGRAALTQFDGADAQRVAHGQRRVFRQVFLQQTVGAFHPAQGIHRQTLRPCAVIGGQLVQRPRRQEL